jgi:tyrosinase
MPPALPAGAKQRYLRSLEAPNDHVFSSTTSAERWNDGIEEDAELVVPIESPHTKMHLAISGIQNPSQNASSTPSTNRDMAENDTASFDPIFFQTDRIEMEPGRYGPSWWYRVEGAYEGGT